MLYKNMQAMVPSPDEDTDIFDIVAGVLQGDTLAPYSFIQCLDYVPRTPIHLLKENSFKLKKKIRCRWYPTETKRYANDADDLELLANEPAQAES